MFENRKLKNVVNNLAFAIGYKVDESGLLLPVSIDNTPVTRGEVKLLVDQINAIINYLNIEIGAEFIPAKQAETKFTVRKISKK